MHAVLVCPFLSRALTLHREDCLPKKENNDKHDDLEEALPDNVSPHYRRHDVLRLRVGPLAQQLGCWRLRREGQCCHRVHDEVHPQHLDGRERTFVRNDASEKGNEHGDDIDRELELQELTDGRIDIAAPQDCSDNG